MKPLQKAVRAEAKRLTPVVSGGLAKGNRSKDGRGPVLFVAQDRKVASALSISRKYPKGFPKVHYVSSVPSRGAMADIFIERAYDAIYPRRLELIMEGIDKMLQDENLRQWVQFRASTGL
jgi:hypothetical protein